MHVLDVSPVGMGRLAYRAVPPLPGATNTRLNTRALRQLPGKRVFAAAAADHQHFHGFAAGRPKAKRTPSGGSDDTKCSVGAS
jgi:hypothetical protein